MRHFNAKETYDTNPYIHKHIDLWIDDSEFDFKLDKPTLPQGDSLIEKSDRNTRLMMKPSL